MAGFTSPSPYISGVTFLERKRQLHTRTCTSNGIRGMLFSPNSARGRHIKKRRACLCASEAAPRQDRDCGNPGDSSSSLPVFGRVPESPRVVRKVDLP